MHSGSLAKTSDVGPGHLVGSGWNTRIDKPEKKQKQQAGNTGTCLRSYQIFSGYFTVQHWDIQEKCKNEK